MTDYDFILDNMRFSYSSASSYNTCPYGFRLSYIDAEERIGNAFSDYGTLVHKTLEKYFMGELDMWELVDYYKNNFESAMSSDFPPYPANMYDNYYKSGLEFFESFEFDKNLYDIISIEDAIYAKYGNIDLIVKPDLILKERSTGNHILIDYKTAKLKSGKYKEQQIEGYKKQFYLYAYFLWTEKEIEIKQIKIWFIRDRQEVIIDVDPVTAQNVVDWFLDTVEKIKIEKDWQPNNTKENAYFCSQICSVRNSCTYMHS